MVDVLFATNRQQLPNTAQNIPDFGDEALPAEPGNLFYGAASVAGIDIQQPANGTISTIGGLTRGGFAPAQMNALVQSTKDILIFVHGAANAFSDAIVRGAYNKTWLSAAGLTQDGQPVSSDFDVIVFTWPSRSYDFVNIVGDYIDYRHDQTEAQLSAYHFGQFLQWMAVLQQRTGNRKFNLLCHSMGNYMLAGAVELVFQNTAAPLAPWFDEVILAAADEQANSFSVPNNGRFGNLWRLGREITLYYNNDDIMMTLSHLANGDYRLGYDGPPDKANTQRFSKNVYEFVNCTGIDDYISSVFDAPDRSHQYYRQSPKVRADIAASLCGLAPARPQYDPDTNIYSLFPENPVVAAAEPVDQG